MREVYAQLSELKGELQHMRHLRTQQSEYSSGDDEDEEEDSEEGEEGSESGPFSEGAGDKLLTGLEQRYQRLMRAGTILQQK